MLIMTPLEDFDATLAIGVTCMHNGSARRRAAGSGPISACMRAVSSSPRCLSGVDWAETCHKAAFRALLVPDYILSYFESRCLEHVSQTFDIRNLSIRSEAPSLW